MSEQIAICLGDEKTKVVPSVAEASPVRECHPHNNDRKKHGGNLSKQEATTWGTMTAKYCLSHPASPPSTLSKPRRSHHQSPEVRKGGRKKDQAGGDWEDASILPPLSLSRPEPRFHFGGKFEFHCDGRLVF